MKNILRGALLATAAIAPMAVPFGSVAYGQTATRNYSIAAQDLGDALRQFASQSGRDVTFDPAIAKGKRSKAVQGNLGPDQALKALLGGSGLNYKATSSGFAVTSPGNALAGAQNAGNEGASSSGEDAGEQEQNVPEILVVGSRSLNADIRRTQNDVQAYVVFDSKQLASSNATSVEEFLRNRLVMDTEQSRYTDFPTPQLGSRSKFNLRGLGINQTLVLINGRRAPATSSISINGNSQQPDINGIPLSSIDRIEVLPSTASGIYGGGATGGVINVILKRDYKGLQALARYDNTFETDTGLLRLELSGGTSLFGGRTQISFSAATAKGKDLLVGDRDFSRRAIALQLKNNPTGMPTNFVGYTTNIRSLNGGPLVLDNGLTLGSNIAFVPVGTTDILADGGTGIAATAGTRNFTPPNDLTGDQAHLLVNPRTKALTVSIAQEIDDNLRGFVDVSYTANNSVSRIQPGSNFVVLQGSDQGNPFQNNVFISVPLVGLVSISKNRSEVLRSNVGVIYRFGKWSGQVEYNWAKSSTSATFATQPISFKFNLDARAGVINLFRDLNINPIDFTPYKLDPTEYKPSDSVLKEVAARVGGPLFKLPTGEVLFTGVLSTRSENLKETETILAADTILDPTSSALRLFYPARGSRVLSAYGEMHIPILGENFRLPGFYALEGQLSLRYDKYKMSSVPNGSIVYSEGDDPVIPDAFTNEFSSIDFTAGVRYSPIRDIAIRAVYSTGFLPPALNQIAPTILTNTTVDIWDPLREDTNTLYQVDRYLSGGNPNLQPETSKSVTLGVIVTPRILPGLRLSADHLILEKSNEVTSLGTRDLILNSDVFGDRIVRGPNLPGDQPGWPGPIVELDISPVNLYRTRLRSVDFTANYSFGDARFGEVDLYGVATRNISFKRQVSTTSAPLEQVGYRSGIIKWRANFGAGWAKGPWSVNWNTRYYSGAHIWAAGSSDATKTRDTLNQGSDHVRAQTYSDMNVRYSLDTGPLNGTQLSVGISNIFNQKPPSIAYIFNPRGIYSNGDILLRRYSITLKKAF